MLTELQSVAVVIAANVLAFFFIFLWHLWLAPYELAIEAVEGAKTALKNVPVEQRPVVTASVPTFNFRPLQLRQQWNVSELASVLAAIDKSGENRGVAAMRYTKTIVEAMKAGKLNYIAQAIPNVRGHFYPPDNETELKKDDAIIWAESVGFDMTPAKD